MELALDLERELNEAEREGRTAAEQVAVMLERGLGLEILRRMTTLLVEALEAQKLLRNPPEKCKKCGGPADAHTRLPVLGPEAGLCLKCCPGCGGLAEAVGLGICKTCGSLTLKEDLEEGVHRGGCTLAGGPGRGN